MIAINGVSPELLVPPANAPRVTLYPRGMAPRIVNLDEWSSHLLQRLRRQASITGDPELAELHEELSSYPGVSLEAPHDEFTGAEVVLPLRVRNGDDQLEFFSTVSTFATAVDITLAELLIEAFYPANAHTAIRLLCDIGAETSA
jgi:MmyB-like transcription regulator ligand binding domain